MEEREPNHALIREFLNDPAWETNIFVLLNTIGKEYPDMIGDLIGHIGRLAKFALETKDKQIAADWHGLDMAINMILWKGRLTDEQYLIFASPIVKEYCKDGDISGFSINGQNFLKRFLYILRENGGFVNSYWAKNYGYLEYYKLFLEVNKDVEA